MIGNASAFLKFVSLMMVSCLLYSGCKKKSFIEPTSPVDSTGIEVPEDTAMFHDTVRLSFAPGFEEVLINKKIIKDQKKDGFVRYGEIKNIDSLDLSISSYGHYNFTSLKGIEYFTKLRYLDMSASYVKTVDLSKNENLEYLDCSGASFGAGWNQTIKKLDVTKCKNLRYLDCEINLLSSLDLSQNLKLKEFYCLGNNFKYIDISNNRMLRILDVSGNREMEDLYLGNCPELEELYFSENNFRSVDLSKLKKLKVLNCSGNGVTDIFQTLDLTNNTQLITLDISYSSLKGIDLSKNGKIKNLICGGTTFKKIDLSNLKDLRGFDCSYSKLYSIDLSNNTALEALEVAGTLFTELNLENNRKIRYFIGYQQDYFSNLDLSFCKELALCYTFQCPNLKTICVNIIPDSMDEKWKTNEWTEYVTCR